MYLRLSATTLLMGALLFLSAANPVLAQGSTAGDSRTGSFAQLAWGTFDVEGQRGYWKTSMLFMNIGAAAENVTISTFSVEGTPIAVPFVGRVPVTQPTITIPPGGTVQLDLDEQAGPLAAGWAQVTMGLSIRAQGIYTQAVPGRPTSQAVAPLVARDPARCILPFPSDTSGYPDVLVLPFDNGGFSTSYAFANTTDTARTLNVNFVDASGALLFSLTQDVPSRGHMAFDSTQYPQLRGQRGQAIVTKEADAWTAIGFLFNVAQSTFTTALPIVR